MRRTLLAGAVVGLVAVMGVAAPAQARPHAHRTTAVVRVFHGVPDLPVDVYVGGVKLLDDFQPGTFSPSVRVPAGRYAIRVTAADATDATHPLLKATYRFIGHRNYTVAAHLTASGAPTLTKYRNVTSRVAAKSARVTVRHDAAAPAVDVIVNGTPAMVTLTNPHESRAVAPAGTYTAAIALAGTTDPVIGPVDIRLARRTNTIVYAWGSAEAGNLAVAVQHVTLR